MEINPKVIEEAIKKADGFIKDGNCYRWQGDFLAKGYGVVRVKRIIFLAHRLVAVRHGIIKDYYDKRLVCHTCNNRWCINSEHLYAGDYSTNAKDTVSSGNHVNASKEHCPAGHEYTHTNSRGDRVCRVCHNKNERKYNEKKRMKRYDY